MVSRQGPPDRVAVRSPAAPRLIVAHTGLRGIAALLVVFYHFQYAPYRLPFETATQVFRRGYLWVDLFFVLSGFIISYTNAAERAAAFTPRGTRDFLVARLARIYPLHVFCLGYLAVLVGGVVLSYRVMGRGLPIDASTYRPADFLEQLLLVRAWIPGPLGWNIPSWSISAEAVAYLLFPLVVSLHAAARRPVRVALLAFALFFYGYVATTGGSLDIVTGLAPLRCLAGFFLGMLVYYHREAFERLPSPVLTVLQVGATLAIAAGLAFPMNDVILMPAFVLLVAATWPDRGAVARLLGWRPLEFLGAISYSVYLNHICVLFAFGFVWARLAERLNLGPVASRIGSLGLGTALILVVSYGTFRWIEAPSRRFLLRRLLHRGRRVPSNVPVAP